MYIGKTPTVGNFQKCDAISVVNGQAAYTLQVSSTNVSPESVNHMIVSLNGIIQAPTTAYTVSGATLTFASNLATGDVIDFVLLLGNVLDVGTPTDNTVATAKIQDDAVTLAKMAAGTDGNIISYDASGNPVAIATGNDGQVLTSAGAGQPPAFEAAAAGGKIGQVVTSTPTSAVQTTTSTSFVDVTNVNVNITPSATSSKILIFVQLPYITPTATYYMAYDILRDTTSLGPHSTYQMCRLNEQTASSYIGLAQLQWIDSPSSTSQINYKVQFATQGNTATTGVEGTPQFITCMEILA